LDDEIAITISFNPVLGFLSAATRKRMIKALIQGHSF
jgi:hypothetical protein